MVTQLFGLPHDAIALCEDVRPQRCAKEYAVKSGSSISRRALIRGGGALGSLLAIPGAARAGAVQPSAATTPDVAPATASVYEAIGVRPLINARGTYTIISGSTMLPEVRAAMDAAAQHYVHLDELTEAIGARLATLTGAEWGMVSNGCAAGLTLATAACVAGGNPDLHVRLPNLSGFPRDEVVIPAHSRNVYDAAVRAVGVRVVEVATPAELEGSIGPRTALIYILAGPSADNSPMSVQAIAPLAKARGVPILVDAAAEVLTIPNVHLQNGATLVAYSGGKCMRGPQTAGLLLGRKDLVRAAWVHSAPHHGITRSLKVGKEDAIGMLTAVEMWVRRDHAAEWKQWTAWLDHIDGRIRSIPGVTTAVIQPDGLSNKTPSLRVMWSREHVGRDADAGEERIIADRLAGLLSKPPPQPAQATPATPAADLSGQWTVRIQFAATASTHTLHLTQRGNDLGGLHQGEFKTREITGSIDGDAVRIRSAYGEQHGDAVSLTFAGKVSLDQMAGTLDMGEYLSATWTASRRDGWRG